MRTSATKAILVLLIIVLNLPLMGCGRGYYIKGRVVFLEQNEIAVGRIEEITGKIMPLEGKPVVGARIVMTHELDKQDKPVKGTVWRTDTTTDAEGYFEIKDYGPPFKQERVGLDVSKEGFKSVYTTYIDYSDKEPQVFYIVLVKDRV
jgi:hypothetical protein